MKSKGIYVLDVSEHEQRSRFAGKATEGKRLWRFRGKGWSISAPDAIITALAKPVVCLPRTGGAVY